MRRALRAAAHVLCAAGAVLLAGLEVWLAWAWVWGTLYVRRSGGPEANPYAAEDAELAGLAALALLPLFLAVLAPAVCRMAGVHADSSAAAGGLEEKQGENPLER